MNYHDFDVFYSLCSGAKNRLVLQESCLVSHIDILQFYRCIFSFLWKREMEKESSVLFFKESQSTAYD